MPPGPSAGPLVGTTVAGAVIEAGTGTAGPFATAGADLNEVAVRIVCRGMTLVKPVLAADNATLLTTA
ncbi:hypothetical protein WCLP8_4690015 [uncultured Gammaproteobacteria bacterium]